MFSHMTMDDPEPTETDVAAGRRQRFLQMLAGDREITWSDWAIPMDDSQLLSSKGHEVVTWAVGVLQPFLGDDFLQRVRDAGAEHALLSPALLHTLWMIVDSQYVYADLIQLAAQMTLLGHRSGRLRATMRNNFDPTSWTHALIQLELASLALRDGWDGQFEPRLDDGKSADVRLSKDGAPVLFEITSMGMSVDEREALDYFHSLSTQIMSIELRQGVQVTGDLGDIAPASEVARWLERIEEAAAATAQDGDVRPVAGPAEATVIVSREALEPGGTHLQGASVTSDPWRRLVARIERKARQTSSAERVWIRLEDHAGLLWFSPLAQMSLADRLAALVPPLREAINSFPHVAGVVVSPGPMWPPDTATEETCQLPGDDGAVALRRPISGPRVRETIIVSRSDARDGGIAAIQDWYRQETTWLDWALQQLNCPRLTDLFITGD
jgi:hypothetical protein